MVPHNELEVKDAIRNLRINVLQCTQTRLAEMLGVTLSTIAKWESGKVQPSPMALMAIARHDFENKAEWLRRAGQLHADVDSLVEGYKSVFSINETENVVVPIHGSAGAGPNRFPPENAEARISLPNSWFKANQKVIGLRVCGDSMAPLIEHGFLVLVDIHDNKDFAALDGKIVAARDEHGVCIKWLRRAGGHFYLISQNVSTEYPPIEVEKNGYTIVGKVVKWIGGPSEAPSKK